MRRLRLIGIVEFKYSVCFEENELIVIVLVELELNASWFIKVPVSKLLKLKSWLLTFLCTVDVNCNFGYFNLVSDQNFSKKKSNLLFIKGNSHRENLELVHLTISRNILFLNLLECLIVTDGNKFLLGHHISSHG